MSKFSQEALDIMKNTAGGNSSKSIDKSRMLNRNDTKGLEELDEMVFGGYIMPEEEKNKNNGQDVLKNTLKEVYEGNITQETKNRLAERMANSHMPKGILDEVLANPLISKMDFMERDEIDNLMEGVTNNIKKKGLMNSLETQKQITERLEQKDIEKVRKINEMRMQNNNNQQQPKPQSQQQYQQGGNIDYALIKNIVENVVDSRMNKMMQLNESRGNNGRSNNLIEGILMKDENTFWFRDTDNNIFECTLKYKGKNVANRKK